MFPCKHLGIALEKGGVIARVSHSTLYLSKQKHWSANLTHACQSVSSTSSTIGRIVRL